MADNGRWWKLWVTAPYDPDLGSLSLDDFARWCLFGVYLKVHGENGVVHLTDPALPVQNIFRVSSFESVLAVLQKFPNCSVTSVTNTTVTYKIEWCNWAKYQGDFSGDRVRKHRAKSAPRVTDQEEKRGEEKRGEEKEQKPSVGQAPQHAQNGFKESAEKILQWLNEKSHRNYRPSSTNLDFIVNRLRDGIADWQLRAIVARKCRDWDTDEMRKYLRPATLFNKTKCEQYLGELPKEDRNGMS
jgi:uncharacterized phage protein (TIGR02220 family)